MDAIIKLSSPETKEFWKIPILHEDEDLLAIDKPAGLLTSPDRYDTARPNLMKLLHAAIARGADWATKRGITYLANVHRLDFGTSGVILLARNKPALINVANQFGESKPRKVYLALSHGSGLDDQFTVDAPIAPHPIHIGVMRVDPKGGKEARTDFTVLERFSGYSLIQCFPKTGRTHQIRVHLKHVQLPIVGDTNYGGHELKLSALKRDYQFKNKVEERPLMGRLALHAEKLTVLQPTTGQEVTMEADIPKDFEVSVKYLRKFANFR